MAGIVLDNTPSTSIENSIFFAMSSDGKSIDDVTIPFVFLFRVEASQLVQAIISAHGSLTVTISGVIQKEREKETQLKAPTDPSIIDLLKSTLRQILTRQTSQNLSSSQSATNVPAVSSTLDEDTLTISYAYLQAQIKTSEPPEHVVKINLNAKKLDTFFETPKNVYANETNWTFMKKLLVNELFGTVKLNLGFLVQRSGIFKFYSLVMSERGVDEETIKSTPMTKKILWFLKELSEVNPDASIVSLYQDLFPNIHKQYFLGYLFRISAFNVKKYIEREIVKEIEDFNKLSVERLINSIINKTHKIQPGEFDRFMKKYVPIIINYIALYSLESLDKPAKSKESLDKDVFSINEFVTINKDLIINVDPTKIFDSAIEPASKKKAAELYNKKEGVIHLELASQFDEIFEDLKVRKKNEDNVLLAKSKDKNQELNEESVPNTQVKDSKNSNSAKDNDVPPKKQESTGAPVDGDKHGKERVHDDL